MTASLTPLPPSFYRTDAVTLARALLGKALVRQTPNGPLVGLISETEAYRGVIDKASHAYNGGSPEGKRTPRTETMFLPGGHAYVYLIYGIYTCVNLTAGEEGNPEAVLIRSAVPAFGWERMLDQYAAFQGKRKRAVPSVEKFRKKPALLTEGPGRLCAAMGIDRTLDKTNVTQADAPLLVTDVGLVPAFGVGTSPRVGIEYAEEAALFPWRFTALPPQPGGVSHQPCPIQFDLFCAT